MGAGRAQPRPYDYGPDARPSHAAATGRDSGCRSDSDVLNRTISAALRVAPGQSLSRKLVRQSLRQLEKRTLKPALKFCVLGFWDSGTALAALRSKIGERRLRVALVKQEIYPGLYNTLDQDLRSLLRSSFKHTGPLALFRDCRAEFIILRLEDDTECQVWREKVLDCGQGDFESYLSVPQTKLRDAQAPTAQLARSASAIEWDRFDLVVSIDVSIPTRIVKAHPQVTWAYYISEPCMKAYRLSEERPRFGYDLFFNQRMHEAKFLYWPCVQKIDRFPLQSTILWAVRFGNSCKSVGRRKSLGDLCRSPFLPRFHDPGVGSARRVRTHPNSVTEYDGYHGGTPRE